MGQNILRLDVLMMNYHINCEKKVGVDPAGGTTRKTSDQTINEILIVFLLMGFMNINRLGKISCFMIQHG